VRKDPKTGEEIKAHLEMDPDVQPLAQKPRHVPHHVEEPLKKLLKQAQESGLFEKIPSREAIMWCSQ
jgi:hypothetical protein